MNNANQDNLWSELTKQGHRDRTLDSHLDVKTIMDSWTLKMGYPVINVKRLVSAAKLVITQKWFLLNSVSKIYSRHDFYVNYKWYVPFTYTTKHELNFEFESKSYWIRPNDTEGRNILNQ